MLVWWIVTITPPTPHPPSFWPRRYRSLDCALFCLIINQVHSWQSPSRPTQRSLWLGLHISHCAVTDSWCGWKSIAPCSLPITVFVKAKHIISKGSLKESVCFIFVELHSNYCFPVIFPGIKTTQTISTIFTTSVFCPEMLCPFMTFVFDTHFILYQV